MEEPTHTLTLARLLRRCAGFGVLTFLGPLCFAVYGVQHEVGQQDGVPWRMAGTALVVLGGWLLFAPTRK